MLNICSLKLCQIVEVNINTYNYNSIVFSAVVDHDYCFSDFEVSYKGSESDGGMFQNSPLWIMDVFGRGIAS